MKILILANNDVGLYRFRRELIEALLKKASVSVSLPYGALVEPLKKMGCRFIDTQLERRGKNPFHDFQLFCFYLRLLANDRPDLVLTYTIKPNIYGGLSCRLLRIPYAANITGLGTSFQKKGLLRSFVIGSYRHSLKKAHTVFFENEENRQVFLDNRIIREKQSVLLHGAGVDLKEYTYQEYPVGTTTRFLFIGRVMKEKGIEELLSALKRLNQEDVSCCLDILGEYEEDYQGRIQALETEGKLHFWGYQENVKPFIEASHCFVLPSWHEGMANTNLECSACGRPVITSDIPGCREAVIDRVTGYLCKSKDADSLYRAMKRFCELSYEQRREMGLAGRRHMERVFDREKVVEETISRLYR